MSVIDTPITIQGRNADLYVEQVGPQDAASVLYLHGGPGYNAFSFRDLVGDELREWRMLYADQRGGGRSYADGDFTSDDLVADAITVLDATQRDSATLLAHGFGALVAVKVAAFHPDRVDGLVLINPWFSMPALAKVLHRTATHAADSDAGGAGDAPDDPAQAVDEAFALSDPKTLFDSLEFPNPASLMHLEHIDSIAHYGPQERSVPLDTWTADALPHLDDVRCGVVTLFSTEDGTAMPEQAELGLARLPQATTGMVQGGHYPWLDDPETFFPLLQEALQGFGRS